MHMKPLFFVFLISLSCLSVKVQAQCCNMLYEAPFNGAVTINGVEVTGAGMGDFFQNTSWSKSFCGIIEHFGGLTIGDFGIGSYTYFFSTPVSQITIAGAPFDTGETFTFTTNGSGNTVIDVNSNCISNFIINNNTLTTTISSGGYVKIANTGGTFTELTISNATGTPDPSGVVFSICSISMLPVASLVTSTPELSTDYLTNVCPVTTVDLTAIVTNTPPVGVDVVWFTNDKHIGNPYPAPSAATTGIYYAFFYDVAENCYSPASNSVFVETTGCEPCTKAFQSLKPTVLSGFNGVVANANFTGKVYIPSNITLGGNVSFTNAEVLLEPNVKIIIPNNSNSFNIVSSHFYTCGGRWKGIEVTGTPQINIDGTYTSSTPPFIPQTSSLIEDAETAIFVDYKDNPSTDGNYINISNTIFNRNNVSIQLENYTGNSDNLIVYPVSITNTIFTCRDIPFVSGSGSWDNINIVSGSTSGGNLITPNTYTAPYINNSNYPPDVTEAYLKDPVNLGAYTNSKPQAGVYIKNINGTTTTGADAGVVIGIASGLSIENYDTNIFDNLNTGIHAERTNITVHNCTFQNGTGWHGYGILSMGSCVPVPNNQLDCTNNNVINISKIPGSPNNAFFNMKTAIEIAGGKQITIKDCDIRSSQSNTDIDSNLYLIGSYGIRVGNHYFENINISNNKLYNIRNAINVFCARDRIPNNVINPIDVGRISVDNNIIKKELPGGNAVQGYSGTEYIENAIHIASLYLHHENAEPVLCKNNTIQEAINGIKLSYWQNKHTQVDSNTITLAEHPTNTNPNLETYGICLEAGFGINETGLGNTVTDNTITGAGMNANSNGTGILLMQQGNTNIGCNTVRNNKHGFRFFGNNPNTQFWDNTMDADNQYGFTLDNGIIGMQGNLPTVTGGGYICPSNNSWQYAMDNTYWNAANDQYMTNCINSLPSQSPLVVLDINGQEHLNPDGSGTSDPYISGYFYQHTGDPLTELIWYAPYSDTECDHCTNATYYGRNSEDFTILEQIADGTILLLNDRPEDRLLVMQEQLFELLYAQPDLLANSNSLQQFIYNNQWTSLDFIYYAGQMLREGNMEMVQILLDYWPNENSNLSEAYYAYFEWLLNMYSDPKYQPDLNEVWELANQCPLTHGTIVYAVRNLYNTLTEKINDFENNCEPPAARGGNKPAFIRLKEPKKKIEVQEKEKTKLVLYPNPTNGIVNISFPDIKQVSVIDITGRTVLGKQTGGVNNMQLNVGSIGKGIFLVRVTDTKGNAHTSKLVIQ